MLGIFGKYGVYLATYWMDEWGQFTYAGFKIFRNYDGNKSAFGETSVYASNPDKEKISVYASQKAGGESTHVVIINKSTEALKGLKISVKSPNKLSSGEAWGFDAEDSKITKRQDFTGIKAGTVTLEMPPLSAFHLVLK